MNNILKQSAEADTSLGDKHFSYAVTRLTLAYAVGAFLILAIFSTIVYALFIARLPPAIEPAEAESDEVHGLFEDEPIEHELRENLLVVLLVADGVLFGFIVLVGYALSRKTLAPLHASYVRQRRFVSDVAHELRTPIAVLSAGSEYILAGNRPAEEYRSFSQVVYEESQDLSAMVENLLILARSDEGVVVPHTSVGLSALVVRESAHLRVYATSRKITLTSDVAPQVTVLGDALQLTRLLMNLGKNAIDYNTQNGTVRITLTRGEKGPVLSVADTGIGIPPEAHRAVFDRFYKVDDARARTSGGAGLGLSIVQSIVTQHHATIELVSAPGDGTTMQITFPAH